MKPKPDSTPPTNTGSLSQAPDQRGANRTSRLQGLLEDMETFSYGISHDLRAPLRAITGFSDVLIEEHSSSLNAEGKEYLKRINAASRRMDQLIRDVLNFNQTSKGDLVLVPVNPVSLIKEVIAIYPDLDASLISITVGPVIPPVLANEAALVQCISNILRNAAKFGVDGIKPEVIVSSTLTHGAVRISFKDNGIGIAPENHSRVFEMFERLDQKHEGTGIGLSVVKRTVERMGGRIGLNSELGKGTTVWMEFASATRPSLGFR